MRKCNADRVFLVDHPGKQIVTYRDLLTDLAATYRPDSLYQPGGMYQPVSDRCPRATAPLPQPASDRRPPTLGQSAGRLVEIAEGGEEEHRSENGYYGCYGTLLGVIARILRNLDCDLRVPLDANSSFNAGLSDLAFLLSDGTFDGEALASRMLASSSRVILSTSGTTGDPKPIVQSISNLARTVQIAPKHDADIWGLAYLPTKIAGLQVLLQALFNTNTIVNLFGLPIATARERIHEYRMTHLSATPTYFRLLAADSTPFPDIQAITVGGEVADSQLRTRLRTLFPNAKFRNIYASSETGTLLQSTGDSFLIPDSLRNSIQIQEGRLWVHRNLLAVNLQTDCLEEFWDTGDEVELISDQPLHLRITGRRSDWINVGGLKVNPHAVETALRSLPGILDARVYGLANSVTGNLVAAELSVDPSFSQTIADIRRLLQGFLPAHAIPRVIMFSHGISISQSGKKERRE